MSSVTSAGQRICLVPKLNGLGGMVSFQKKLAQGLANQGYQAVYSLDDHPYAAVLVIGGISDLAGLWRAKRRGVRIVQRLDGMNWLHRRRNTGVRHYLRSEYGNRILSLIRSRLASRIVYQSQFAQSWWERTHSQAFSPATVIYNGVDLERYSPSGPQNRPDDCYRLLLVEGTLGGGYEVGLETAVALTGQLNRTEAGLELPVELVVAGRVSATFQTEWQNRAQVSLHFLGQVAAEQIPENDRSAHLLFSADLNAACPNSVIEALACGLPVVAFATGALPELVQGQAGRVVPYGGDPWKLDPPDVPALGRAAAEILKNQPPFREGARRRAERAFGLDQMVASYLDVLLG